VQEKKGRGTKSKMDGGGSTERSIWESLTFNQNSTIEVGIGEEIPTDRKKSTASKKGKIDEATREPLREKARRSPI